MSKYLKILAPLFMVRLVVRGLPDFIQAFTKTLVASPS
jgi:hypothetical protein